MIYLPVNGDSIKKAAEIILSGGLVAFPTETVYGLGANAYDAKALAKVFEAKGRPRFDPLIIHIAAIETLESVAALSLLTAQARKKLFLLAENLMPGPLSVVLPKNEKIPGIATAGLPTAAIRFPDHETAQKLISLSGGAIAAPSANPFGSLSPTRAEHVRDKLGDKIDMILDGGSARIGLESTVLDITGDHIRILRPGGTPKEAIEKVIGFELCPQQKTQTFGSEGDEQTTFPSPQSLVPSPQSPVPSPQSSVPSPQSSVLSPQISPGQLKSHYAPKIPLFAMEREKIIKQPYKTGCAFLFFDDSTKNIWFNAQKCHDASAVRVLSGVGDVLEAASRLFETLYELDGGGFSRIFAQFAPPEGLGEAINDRLRRASS